MEKHALISVIVPIYNVASYLPDCLSSIVNQSYDNLEIILVDDGSQDMSASICDTWAAADSRIRVLHQQNAGVSCARNAGLNICTGDLISFVDADDWLDLQMFEKLEQCLNENDADAAMCGFVDYPHGLPVEKGLFPVPVCDFTGTVYQIMRRNGYFTSPWAKLFRRELVFRGGRAVQYDPTLFFGEDEVWLLEVLRECKRTAFLPEALYYYRRRDDSITRSELLTERQLTILKAKAKSFRLLPDDASILSLAKARAYNYYSILKVQAYCAGDKKAMDMLTMTASSMRNDFLRSPEYIPMRKLKLLFIEAEMLLHMPKALVRWTNERTH